MLDFAHEIGVVVQVCWVGIGCDGKAVSALGIGDGRALAGIEQAIGILVQEQGPACHADFVVGSAHHVVGTVDVAQAVAVHVVEFHAADFAIDDGRGHELDRGGPFASDIDGGLQGTTGPSGSTQGFPFALIRHSTGRGDHQTILDFGTTALCGGAGVGEGDGDLTIHRSTTPRDVGDVTDTRDIGVDRLKNALHSATVGKTGVICCDKAGKVAGVSVHIGRGHEQKATGIRVGLVVVVSHIEGVTLAVDQRLAVARFVEKYVGNDFTLEVI